MADLENVVGGGANICWLLVVTGHLVIGDNSGSRSHSVVTHIVNRLFLVAIFHTVQYWEGARAQVIGSPHPCPWHAYFSGERGGLGPLGPMLDLPLGMQEWQYPKPQKLWVRKVVCS